MSVGILKGTRGFGVLGFGFKPHYLDTWTLNPKPGDARRLQMA